ncbi:hypothetical protein E8E12_007120 [Didymella heteroderae]|uniref:Uncharacterized protein n=1 Tax=Didymella heteroderae TaxID=1769908 RepID=A0A9P4WZG7_9PLEO|nr:hypothetical protein E8E12_007120 [Didymella heteroderae]
MDCKTDGSAAKDTSANGSCVKETEAVQPNNMLSGDNIVGVTEAFADNSEDNQSLSRSGYLRDIDDYIATEGLAVTTFAISDDKGYFDDRKLLLLGGMDSFQVWARLKTYSSKPDEVEYVRCSFLSHQIRATHDLSRLPISMYPFRPLAGNKDKLTVLIRYLFTTGVMASSIESDKEPVEPRSRRMAKPKSKPKPKPNSTAAPKKIVPVKRRADQAGLEGGDGYTQLEDLEVERNGIEEEQAEISKRQADRKREEKEDTERMKELETRKKNVEKEERTLLKDRSAAWLLACQRQHRKPEDVMGLNRSL